ncbi:hypothetical protein CRYUN_Cryun01aG0216900 [Craigia yunnanensis]
MSLRSLGRYRRDLGLQKRRRFIALLRKFPGVFEIMEEGAFSLRFRLTPEAEGLYLDELRVRNEMEDFLGLRSGTPKKEKHACAIIHEILSLTVRSKLLWITSLIFERSLDSLSNFEG